MFLNWRNAGFKKLPAKIAARRMIFGLFGLIVTIAVNSAGQNASPDSEAASSAQPAASVAPSGIIRGRVQSGATPIPGATITATNASSGAKITTWTAVDGTFSLPIPAEGEYSVTCEMIAFASSTQQVIVDANHQQADINFALTLLSRVSKSPQPDGIQAKQSNAGNPQASNRRGFQSLAVTQSGNPEDLSANGGADQTPAGMPVPGIAPDAATETVTVSGSGSSSAGGMSSGEMQQRMTEFREQNSSGGFGPGGGHGGGPGMLMMGRGFDANHPHGTIYYTGGAGALNAKPYSLSGQPSANPGYLQNR
ncbi:MAG: carboxypeptidase regulatory-like domain-containing protein, partial [Acidobacteriales bacterium]|nr:carboxypeptidase regulatory-like domain-containing protein [Terriglobales bacterium]